MLGIKLNVLEYVMPCSFLSISVFLQDFAQLGEVIYALLQLVRFFFVPSAYTIPISCRVVFHIIITPGHDVAFHPSTSNIPAWGFVSTHSNIYYTMAVVMIHIDLPEVGRLMSG